MSSKQLVEQSIAQKPLQWLLIAGAVGTAGYFAFKKVMGNSADRLQNSAETTVSTDNPFSYTKFLSQNIPSGTTMFTVSGANTAATQIYNSLNTFLFDSPDICIGVFNSMQNKLKVAQVAQSFFKLYNRDILQYLQNGNKTIDFGTGGLSNSYYQRILTIVNNKPKF